MTSYNKIITTVNSDTSNIIDRFTPNINSECIIIDTFYNRIGINTLDPLYEIDVSGTINTNKLYANEISSNSLNINHLNVIELSINNLIINNGLTIDVVNISCNKLETNECIIKTSNDISAVITLSGETNHYIIYELSFNIHSVTYTENLFAKSHADYYYNKVPNDLSKLIIRVGTNGFGFLEPDEKILDISLIRHTNNYPDSNTPLKHHVLCAIRLLDRDNNIHDFSSNCINNLDPDKNSNFDNIMKSLGISNTILDDTGNYININNPSSFETYLHYPFTISNEVVFTISNEPMNEYKLLSLTRHNLIIRPPTVDGITGNIIMPSDVYLQKVGFDIDHLMYNNVLIFTLNSENILLEPGIKVEKDEINIGSFLFKPSLNEWSTESGNLNLYDGSLSCTSINITNNNNIFTIDFSNIKTNDELNIISDTLKIESSSCNINIHNNLNIDASNVLIESSNITLSGELINIKGETLINNISFIDNKINSNDLDIIATNIANIICKKLNITSGITTISGNTTIDGSLNIKENGIINKYAHIPIGTIVMWSSPDIPPGWILCDGTNNTPDLINKFVKGGNSSNLGDSSYNDEVIELTMDYLPDHSHNITYNMDTANDNHHYHNYDSDISTQYTNIIHHHTLHDTNVENVDLSHSHPVIQGHHKTSNDNFQHHHNLEDHSHNIQDTNIDHEHYIGSHTHDTEAHFHSVTEYQSTNINYPGLNNNAILITDTTDDIASGINITTLSNNILEGGLLISEPPKNDTPIDKFNNRTGKIIDQNWINKSNINQNDINQNDINTASTIERTHHTHEMTMQAKDISTINVDFSHNHEFNFPSDTSNTNIDHSHNITGNTDEISISHNHIIDDFSSTSYISTHKHEVDISTGLWPGENYANTQKKLKIVPSYYCLYYIMKIGN